MLAKDDLPCYDEDMENETKLNLSYAEMMTEAQKISPAAKIRFVSQGEGFFWEIYIPSNHKPETVLPQRFEGTPVWNAVQAAGGNVEDTLNVWVARASVGAHSYGTIPLEGIAEFYNFFSAVDDEVAAGIKQKEEETQVFGKDWDSFGNDEFSIYTNFVYEVNEAARDRHFKEFAKLSAKWNTLGLKW